MLLKILSNNTLISEHQLVVDQEYLVGRSQDCDIVLESNNGVSRKHLTIIVNDDATLTIRLISKLGELLYNDDFVEELTIPYGEKFYVADFEFLYNEVVIDLDPTSPVLPDETEDSSLNLQEDNQKDLSIEPNASLDFNNEADLEYNDNLNIEANEILSTEEHKKVNDEDIDDEITLTATNHLSVILNILSKSTGKAKKSYELEGNNWIIGRDKKCSLALPYQFMSRKHFELIKTNEGFYIFDFGSSNGTKINGKKLPKKEHIRIYNNDIIGIKSLKIKVELIDQTYKDKIKNIVIEEEVHNQKLVTNEQFNVDDFYQPNLKIKKSSNAGKSIFRALIALIVIGCGYIYTTQNKPKKRNVASIKKVSKKTKNKEVKKETHNQIIISDIFNSAQNYYNEKNYIVCINEFERLHTLVPSFKNSKQLQSLCKQGLEIEEEQKNENERKLQAQKVEQKANKIAKACANQFSNFKTKQELDDCVSKLFILNPGHPIITELQQKWENIQNIKAEKEKNQQAIQKKIKEGNNIITSAQALKNSGQFDKSINLFNKYLSRSYPNKNKFKDLAKREIASMRATIKSQIDKLLNTCITSHSSGKNKETVYACENVLKKYPNNEKASELRYQALKKLRSRARQLFSDGNLEESLGNISAAKEKWNEILSFHVKSDEYYSKAMRKLKKYGDE